MAQAKRKSNSVVTHEVLESGAIKFDVVGAGSFVFDPAKASESNRIYAARHGWIQRLSDAAAIQRDEETGLPASPQDKLDRMIALRDHYESGADDWRITGTSGGGNRSLTVAAIARVKGISVDNAEEHVARYAAAKFEGDTKKCLAFFRTSARVMEAMAEIRKESMGKPSVDADEALEELSA